MIGLGTLINTAAVILGGVLGLLLKNGIAKRFEKILMQALGLATIFIGIGGVLKYMLVPLFPPSPFLCTRDSSPWWLPCSAR